MTATCAPLVYLIGAGPGDPELLTVKAHRVLGEVDAVVYDRLVSREIVALVPAGAARFYVGKAPGSHPLPQPEINRLLTALARGGRRVARLKGGDPFVFGRGGEEAEHLARHGIAFEVVPGVTAAAGCAARAGIPLTHRGLASGVRFVAGHCRGGRALDLDWAGLADPDTTLVFYMALANLGRISERLVAAGLSAATPAVVISHGTTPRQRICRGPLGDIARAVRAADLCPPTLLVVGRVVGLAEALGVTSESPPERSAELVYDYASLV